MSKFASFLSGVAAAAVITSSALAADLPSRKAPPVYVPPPPVFSWTGFYVGLNAGAAIRNNNYNNNVYAALFPAAFGAFGSGGGTNNNVGFVGGGQAGYNWQSGPIVFGLETDAQYRSTLGTQNNPFFAGGNGNAGFYGTARARVGYLFSPMWLAYITGGAAYGNTFTNNNVLFGGSNNSFRVGWTAGGGLEWMFAPNWSVKAEYLYNDLGRTTTGFAAFPGPRTQFHVARLGVNYHFNWGAPAPVVAKY